MSEINPKIFIFLLFISLFLSLLMNYHTVPIYFKYNELEQSYWSQEYYYSKALEDQQLANFRLQQNTFRKSLILLHSVENCYLIVTQGNKPYLIDDQKFNTTMELRTYNLRTNKVNMLFDDGTKRWKYWLVCD